jgi:hypothetical protein
MNKEILILVPKRTNRLVYIFNHFFKELMGLEPEFCISNEKFEAYDGFKIHYGFSAINDEFFIAADELLFERGIKEQELSFGEYYNLPTLFPTYNRDSKYTFDLFSAAFYLLSRYEEYLPFMKDKYGRFPASESVAFRNNFLHKPLIDIWVKDLSFLLKESFPQIEIQRPEYSFTPTIDIDAAYAYKHKGALRIIGGYLKSLKDFDFKDLILRTQVLLGLERDPFDTFDYLFDTIRGNNLKAIFFILFADYGTNDKNIPTYSRAFRELAAYIGDNAEVGIHPSFTSNSITSKLKKEITTLSKTVHQEILKSRQHFLIIHMPSTYRNLITHEIVEDYSMGYADEIGFRASTSRSFLFYDLEMEYTTSLRVHPFAAMEGTLKDYKRLNNEEALNEYKNIIDEIKAVEGTFISIWHNESLSNKKRWIGWKTIFEKMIEYAK